MILIIELLRLSPTQHVTRTLKLTQSVLRTHHLVRPTTLMKQQTKINTRVLMVIAIRMLIQKHFHAIVYVLEYMSLFNRNLNSYNY